MAATAALAGRDQVSAAWSHPSFHLLRRVLPWLAAFALLVLVVARVPRAEALAALSGGPWGLLAAYAAAVVMVTLAADVAATRSAFALTGVPRPFAELLLARGASYLAGLLSPAVGQGGLAFYLHRTGAAPLRAAGAVLFLFATQLGAMAFVAAAGLLMEGTAGDLLRWLPALLAILGALALYLAVIRLRPAWLARRSLLAPCFEAGAGGFLAATLARLPHVLVMALGILGGLRLWGIPLPLGRGLVIADVVLLLAALPLAPAGLGTTQLALVVLVSPYVLTSPQAGPASRDALVLAFSLLYQLFGLAAQALVGAICLGLLTARREGPA